MEITTLYQIFQKSTGLTIDSRKVTTNNIFLGLKGKRVDGNNFANEALEKGAMAAIVDDPEVIPKDSGKSKFIPVKDSLSTLQDLATYHRTQLSIPVLGITGSNGKTTTKALLKTVLSQSYRTFATEGNLNNHIGLPLSVLSLTQNYQMAVLEFGANHKGEHERLCRIAQPTHGLVTNIGKDHLEGYGGMEGVIKAHQEFTNYLKQISGILFTYTDDPHVRELAKDLLKVSYGQANGPNNPDCAGVIKNHFPALSIHVSQSLGSNEPFDLETRLYGSYNFPNVMAAVCIAQYFKLPVHTIQSAISVYEPVKNRSQIIREGQKQIILDAYNANPSSMESAINDFAAIDSPCKMAILGDMSELGDYSEKEHKSIIEKMENLGIKTAFVGPNFYQFKDESENLFFNDIQAAKAWYQTTDLAGCWILVKGSRSLEMEKVLD